MREEEKKKKKRDREMVWDIHSICTSVRKEERKKKRKEEKKKEREKERKRKRMNEYKLRKFRTTYLMERTLQVLCLFHGTAKRHGLFVLLVGTDGPKERTPYTS